MTGLLIVLTLPEPIRNRYYSHLKAKFPQVEINMVDHHGKVGPHIAAADVLVSFGVQLADHVFKEGVRLKWVQALGTGVDGITDQPSLRDDVIVTNMHGFHGAPMSESAILSMLALARNLPRSVSSQRERIWDRFPARTLRDTTAGIFGVGVIAETLAPMCKALGMSVIGISSVVRKVPGFDRMFSRDQLEQAVREIDYLVILTPYTPATHGIVDARVLAAMKPTGCVVNLARGGVLDEEALIRAIEEGRIAGAALDVFATEPLPAESPLWGMKNVIITPHLGGFFDRYPDYALPVVVENMNKFLAGDFRNMVNVVKMPANI